MIIEWLRSLSSVKEGGDYPAPWGVWYVVPSILYQGIKTIKQPTPPDRVVLVANDRCVASWMPGRGLVLGSDA